MLRTLKSIGHGIRALLRPQLHLAIENAALRQQLAVFKQTRPRPSLSNSDRLFWVALRRFWSRWESALLVVKPETVTRWHRESFLRNHREVLAAMDFFTVPTASFRVLYVLFVVHHERRQLLHLGVTEHPTAEWIIGQLREAFPFDTAPRYLIFDGDRKFRGRVENAVKNMGIVPTRTAYRSPWQNGVAERLVGSIRRELLDHVVVANENHLRRLLGHYQSYYSQDRCHLTLGKDPPVPRPIEPRPSHTAKVIALPRVGGIHHRYAWRKHGAKAA